MQAPRSSVSNLPVGRHLVSVDRVRIKVLGPLDVSVDGESLALGGPQQRLVLALLVSRAGSSIATESLVDALWSAQNPPDRARKTVQVYVANLRKALGGQEAPIESASGGYVLRPEAASIDAVDFEAAVAGSRDLADSDPAGAVAQLSRALAMWSGPAYGDLADSSALTAEVTRLNELRLVALERRIEASLELGHHREELGALDALTTDHPYRERFTALQMLALYRSGRQAEALRAYQRTRLILGEELGIDPSPELQDLEQAILTQDPSLDLTARAATDDRTASAGSIRGYELREQLDEAAGEVQLWRAYQPSTGREVALRIVGPAVANDPAFLKRFESETQLLAQLEHPHLVSIYDFWREPEGAYVVMPLMRGGTLQGALRRGQWRLSAALRMVDQVGSALAAVHRSGLVHGSVGPRSIFLDTDSNAYLADVGTTERPARHQNDSATSGQDTRSREQSDIEDLAELFTLSVTPGEIPPDLAVTIADAGQFERVEDLLRAMRRATGSDAIGIAPDTALEEGAPRNPYKGLRAFQESDAADYFGRDVLVGRLIDTVADRPLTTVVGSSGSGKSSLVKAGLVPAVKAGALEGDWLVAEMFPGTFPFEELEAALLRVAVDRPDDLMAELTADDRGMVRVIKQVLPDDGTGLLLVIDQFEELFSLTPDEDTRRLFLDNLVTLGSDARSRVRVILTLRADFFDRPLDHPDLAALVQGGLVTVAMPDQDNLALMVSQPAREAGLDLEPGLVTEVVRDVMQEPGGLPLMQYALTELAESSHGRTLTVAGYRDSGGVLGALAQRAEEIYQGLQPSSRAVAERVFLRLVTVDENADDTRRRIRRTELTKLGLDRSAVESVLQEFGAFRLLSFDHDPATRGPTVEVAHEALIREWPRLRSWVDDQRENLLLERRLREAVAEWQAGDRDPGYLLRGARLAQFESWADSAPGQITEDESLLIAASRAEADSEVDNERRRVRRLRRLVALVGVMLLLALIAGGLAWSQRNNAQDAAEEAELATLISRSAAQSVEDPDVSLLLALEAYQRAPGDETEQAILNALGSSANVNRVLTMDPLFDESTSCPNTEPVDGPGGYGMISSSGFTETVVAEGELVSHDLQRDVVTEHGPSPANCGWWMSDASGDRVVVDSADGLRHWYGPMGGPWVEFETEEESFLVHTSFRPNNLLMYLIPRPGGTDAIQLRDDRNGDPIGGPISAGPNNFWLRANATSDGSLVALSFALDGHPDGDGKILVVDGDTGEEIFRIDHPVPAEGLTFDEREGELIAATFDGAIMTIDLATGEVVSEVTTTRAVALIDLGVSNDGDVIAVSRGQVEFIDRSTGPTGRTIELREAETARIRPDGSLLIVRFDGGMEVIDFGSNSLIEQTWDVDPFAQTAFNKGFAGALSFPPTEAVVVDLTSGARFTYDLTTPAGERFEAIKIYPEPDGIWAFSEDNVMARWQGDELVEQLDLGGWHVVRTQYEDLIAVLSEPPTGPWVVDLVDVGGDQAEVVFRVEAPEGRELIPSLEGGVHIIDADGTLTTYDSNGDQVGEVETGFDEVRVITMDPTTGLLALTADLAASDGRALMVVDPEAGTFRKYGDIGTVSNLGFGRNGEILAMTGRDGTVRLWDVERGEYAGLVWEGAGAGPGSPSWYDPETETIWVASSGKYLQIPLNPDRWVERACQLVSRDLTQDEWDRFVPGDESPRPACPNRV